MDAVQFFQNTTALSRKEQLAHIQELRKEANIQVWDEWFNDLKSPFPALAQKVLEEVRADCKKIKGFASTCFNIFASGKDPLEQVAGKIDSFEKYCRKNRITFNEETGKLTAGDKPKTLMNHLGEWKFAIAAAGGILTGLAGTDLATNPVLEKSIDVFFNYGLQWGAPAFIGLSVFKAFTDNDLKKALPTLARFAAITGAGFLVSIGVNEALSHVIPTVDPSVLTEYVPKSRPSEWSPMLYLPYIMGGMCLAASCHKALKKAFDSDPIGEWGIKAAKSINAAFPTFITYAGIPAITTLLSHTMKDDGIKKLTEYIPFYATAFTGIGIGTALLAGTYYALGARKKDFKEIGRVYKDAVSISSSTFVMGQEKECVKNMGVSEKVRERAITLGGVFNMYGLALYLGQAAFYSQRMFGSEPTIEQYAAGASTIFWLAMGAPGVPASTVAFLQPVMQTMGFTDAQIYKTFAMILPADRFVDMGITGANAASDMLAAVHEDRHRLRYNRAKHISELRAERLEREAAAAGTPPAPGP